MKIQSLQSLRDEMIAVARGERPAPADAALPSFDSVETLIRSLTLEDQRLPSVIKREEPQMEARRVVPVLRIFSVEKAREFYLDYLGFKPDWEHRFEEDAPLYMQVSRDGMSLHLSEHHGDGTPGSVVFVEVTGLDVFHQEISAKDYRYLRPGIEDRPWNAREMQVIDPFGNRIRFTEFND